MGSQAQRTEKDSHYNTVMILFWKDASSVALAQGMDESQCVSG